MRTNYHTPWSTKTVLKVFGTTTTLLLAVAFIGPVIYPPASAQTTGSTRSEPSYTQVPVPLAGPKPAGRRPEVRVIDGDTIVVNGTHYRFDGIDAPELGQRCTDGWPAGDKARAYLQSLIFDKTVTCDLHGTDKYGRLLAKCSTPGVILNQAMVQTGNARAYLHYSYEYITDEVEASKAKLGIWAHDCQAPWDFRHRKAAGGR